MPREYLPTVAEVPGFHIFAVEYCHNGTYKEGYLHIPDDANRDAARRAWIRESGLVPEGAEITYFFLNGCQVHTEPCRRADHEPVFNTPQPMPDEPITLRMEPEVDPQVLDNMRRWISTIEMRLTEQQVQQAASYSVPSWVDEAQRTSNWLTYNSSHPMYPANQVWSCEWGCGCSEQSCTCHNYHDLEYADRNEPPGH